MIHRSEVLPFGGILRWSFLTSTTYVAPWREWLQLWDFHLCQVISSVSLKKKTTSAPLILFFGFGEHSGTFFFQSEEQQV